MQIRAATINSKGGDFKKETIGLDEAQENEVLLRIAASRVKRQPPKHPGWESWNYNYATARLRFQRNILREGRF